jgi:predicted aspartyl protease
MVVRTVSKPTVSGERVGQVVVDFAVENFVDAVTGAPVVRSLQLRRVLMDTGASHLCLPADVISELGLELVAEVPVQIATGMSLRRVFAGVRVRYGDRVTTVDCVELPAGSPPLLGAIPMEGLGIEPDLQHRVVRKLPLDTEHTYFTA